FHETSGKILLVVLVGSFSLLVLYRPRPTLPRLLLVCAGALLALMALRNVPLFGLTAVPVLALHTDPLWRSLPYGREVRRRFETTARATRTLPWVLGATALLLVLCLAQGRVGSVQLIQLGFDKTIFPVTAVAEARRHRLDGRLFTEFVWGGYILYAWPEQRVFIDGGTDFYGEDLFREYTRIKRMSPGWRDDMAKRDISLLLLERDKPFTYEIARDASWSMWYCDSLAVVFRKSSSGSERAAERGDSVDRALNDCGQRSSHPLGHRHE
ncbi:MAG TPA: hypothetical protein VFD73_05265, partial [Gemmatimonadales bacterium]|nr:hypothetical protein [Gemmatimonadales bacterium]